MGNPNTDWQYKANGDPGLNGRALPWPRGKVLGGSSSINGLLYVRGQAQDFDHWRQLGNVGWAWNNILPYFKRAESWKGSPSSDERGKNGPLIVSPSAVKRDIIDSWIDAAVNAGYKENRDYNGKDQEGVGYFQMTAHKGRRCSAAVAYLKPARGRKNLEIITHTQVRKLIISEGRVTGVDAVRKGQQITINARKEVVLSAGAIGSPQILMLSGIGDAEDLAPMGIKVVKNLKGVGKKPTRSSASAPNI